MDWFGQDGILDRVLLVMMVTLSVTVTGIALCVAVSLVKAVWRR